MLTVRTDAQLARALSSPLDPRLKRLLADRRDQLGHDHPLEELAAFAVVEPGNTAADLEAATGLDVFRNAAGGGRWGEPDFSPGWEWIQDHGWAHELCFVTSDSGYGYIVIVIREEGVDAELLKLCAEYSSQRA